MTLAATIEDHRAMYRADLLIPKLVSRQPPTTLDPHTGELHVEPGAATGMPMAGRLLKYLGHPEGYGADFPWTKAAWKLRVECRRKHPHHRGADVPYWRGSLCHELVRFTIIRSYSVQSAVEILRYDNPEPLLREAFRFIEQVIDAERAKAERRAREDEGKFTIYDEAPVHHAPSREHIAECPNPECRKRRAA